MRHASFRQSARLRCSFLAMKDVSGEPDPGTLFLLGAIQSASSLSQNRPRPCSLVQQRLSLVRCLARLCPPVSCRPPRPPAAPALAAILHAACVPVTRVRGRCQLYWWRQSRRAKLLQLGSRVGGARPRQPRDGPAGTAGRKSAAVAGDTRS